MLYRLSLVSERGLKSMEKIHQTWETRKMTKPVAGCTNTYLQVQVLFLPMTVSMMIMSSWKHQCFHWYHDQYEPFYEQQKYPKTVMSCGITRATLKDPRLGQSDSSKSSQAWLQQESITGSASTDKSRDMVNLLFKPGVPPTASQLCRISFLSTETFT